jgi:hypothetical protein
VVPASLGLATGVVTEADIAPYTPSAMLTLVDIHQMAGLALLGMAGLVWLSGRTGVAMRWLALGTAATVALAAPSLWGLATGQAAVDVALALLWGTEWNVFFPLFPWAAYPLVGYAYGHAVVSGADRRLTVRRLAGGGVVAGLVGLGWILATVPAIGVGDYWRQPPAVVLAIVGLIVAWLGLADVVGARLREGGTVLGLLTTWSRSVTAMYCTHWILIGWGVGLVGHRRLDLPAVVLAMVVVLLATDRIVRRWPFGRGRRAAADPESVSVPVPAAPSA